MKRESVDDVLQTTGSCSREDASEKVLRFVHGPQARRNGGLVRPLFRPVCPTGGPLSRFRTKTSTIPDRPPPERKFHVQQETTMSTRQKTRAPTRNLKPRITLTADDYERLSLLVRAAMNTAPDGTSVLADELDRAHVLPKGRHADKTVCMGCEVEFRDDTTGKFQTVRLVYPGEADISQGKISVLTPIGTALIGLRAGQSITWQTRTGDVRRLTVVQVREPQPA